ncbi:MAG: hypothetical protein AAGD23_05890 [Pseudomonadota bacterium]
MGFWDLFKKPPKVNDLETLEDYIESRAAFLAQKCIYEYARARTGLNSEKLFSEPEFQEALDRSRWEAFVMTLADVVEMIAGELRPHLNSARDIDALYNGLEAAAVAIMRSYPVPAMQTSDYWDRKEKWLLERLKPVRLAGSKRVKDIPLQTVEPFFDILPIHKKLTGHDFEMIKNHRRTSLCRTYEEFIGSADVPALAKVVTAERAPVTPPRVGTSLNV